MNISNVLVFGLSIQEATKTYSQCFKLYSLFHMFLILVISNISIQQFFFITNAMMTSLIYSVFSSLVNYKRLLLSNVTTTFSVSILKKKYIFLGKANKQINK